MWAFSFLTIVKSQTTGTVYFLLILLQLFGSYYSYYLYYTLITCINLSVPLFLSVYELWKGIE